jgi:hypothetical protein
LPRNEEKDLDLKWSGRWMLLHRILAVNIFALAVLAGSIFYLDSFRGRLTTGAIAGAETQVGIMADSLAWPNPASGSRCFTGSAPAPEPGCACSAPTANCAWTAGAERPPTYELRDPAREPWRKNVARLLDNLFDAVAGKPPASPLALPEPDRLDGWSEAVAALRAPHATNMLRRAPEGHLVHLGRVEDPGVGRRAAAHPQRPGHQEHRPPRAQDLVDRRLRDPDHVGPAVAVPGADHRPPRCAGWRAPRTRSGWGGHAKWPFPPCPPAATRSASSPARSAT